MSGSVIMGALLNVRSLIEAPLQTYLLILACVRIKYNVAVYIAALPRAARCMHAG